jgi:hypothetical protein
MALFDIGILLGLAGWAVILLAIVVLTPQSKGPGGW